MRTFAWRINANLGQDIPDQRPNCSLIFKTSQWRFGSEKQASRPGIQRPSLLQVGSDGPSHVGGQRHLVDATGLAAKSDAPSLPINVLQSPVGHLSPSQAEASQQQQHGIITSPNG